MGSNRRKMVKARKRPFKVTKTLKGKQTNFIAKPGKLLKNKHLAKKDKSVESQKILAKNQNQPDKNSETRLESYNIHREQNTNNKHKLSGKQINHFNKMFRPEKVRFGETNDRPPILNVKPKLKSATAKTKKTKLSFAADFVRRMAQDNYDQIKNKNVYENNK